jgi:PAP2 superfamily
MRKSKLVAAVVAGLAAALVAGGVGPTAQAQQASGQDRPSRGDAAVLWNAAAADTALARCLAPDANPLHESRMYAIMHLAMHDALNAVRPRYRSYAYRGDARRADPEAAVAAAARTTLIATLSELPPPFDTDGCRGDGAGALDIVETTYAKALSRVADGRAKRMGIALGERSARAMLDRRSGDGSDTPLFVLDFPDGDQPGEYRKTPGFDPRLAFAPGWGGVTPFALRSADQIDLEPPYAVDSDAYTADYQEVKRLGGNGVTTPSDRTADETAIAQFWDESSPLLWNRLARQLAASERLDLWQSARLFGLLNLALTDGYIMTFEAKFRLLFWRPVTAIHLGATDGNDDTAGDPTWTPLRTTPPVPDHDSGHSVEGGAAAAVLRGFFGTDRMRFSLCSYLGAAGTTCTDQTPVRRHFRSFSAAATENARSRVLLGYHFTHATTAGTERGIHLGRFVVDRYLEPRHRR